MSSEQYALAIHTSSPELGLALSNFQGKTRAQTWNLGRELSIQLHQHLAEFISPQTWSDLKYIAVAKGPGSFTGTRMGIVTARILAQQLDLPLFALSTLAVVAWENLTQDSLFQNIAVQMPAQREQLFVAIYAKNEGLVELLPDSVMSPQDWQKTLDHWTTPYQLMSLAGGLGNSATNLLTLADFHWQRGERPHWSKALPYYGQHPVLSS